MNCALAETRRVSERPFNETRDKITLSMSLSGLSEENKGKMARCLRGVMLVLSQLEESVDRERHSEQRAVRLAHENAALRRRLERACAALDPTNFTCSSLLVRIVCAFPVQQPTLACFSVALA